MAEFDGSQCSRYAGRGDEVKLWMKIGNTVVLATVAAWLGWWSGQWQMRRGGVATDVSDRQSSGQSGQNNSDRLRDLGEEKGDGVESMRRRLLKLYGNHPEPRSDWRLKAETHRLLEKMSSDELAALYRLVRFDHFDLAREVRATWARKDGPAAVQATMEGQITGGRILANETFQIWGQQDVEAALAWLDGEDLPAPVLRHAKNLRLNFIREYALVDFDRALRELSRFDGRDKQHLLESWAEFGNRNADIAGKLASYLETHPEDRMVALKGQVSGMAQKDAAAAQAFLATLEVSPQERAALDFAVAIKESNGEDVSSPYQTWMARNPDMTELPQDFWQSFQWSFTVRQDHMEKWMDGLGEGPVRDQIYGRSIRMLAARNSFEKAAAYTEVIADPVLRSEAVATLSERWQAADPVKAKAWQERLK